MNLADRLEARLLPDSLALIRLIKTEAERLSLPLYLVGGSVRDLFFGSVIKDFDLTVEGDAIRLARALAKKHGGTVTVHQKFFTATWYADASHAIDLISARSETYAEPGALPTVQKSSIANDLRRRDFTINAMAIRLDGSRWGELLDPFNGQADLGDRRIRFLHPHSFVDDPTRMFRAVRYGKRFGFRFDPATERALFDESAREVLARLSGERLRHEFDLILAEDPPVLGLVGVTDETGLAGVIHPALAKGRAAALLHVQLPTGEFGDFAAPDILSLRQTLGWCLYLLPLNPSEVDSVAERLAFPAVLTKAARGASALFADLPSFAGWKPSQWTFHLDDLPALSVYAAWLATSEPALREYLTKWRKIRPVTTGADLIARGLEPGPKFKEILTRLRAARLDGEVKSEEEESGLLGRML